VSTQLEFDFPPIRSDTLRRAEHLVTVDREEEHGDMAENFAAIARYWSTHLGVEVTGSDVSVMMALLKVARIKSNARNTDNWIDGCGYLACGAELATRN
jgi:hypothetical protein